MEKITREFVLDSAKKIVCGQREKDYGSPEDSFHSISLFWSIYLREKYSLMVSLDSTDVALMMDLMKTARLIKTPKHMDSWVDKAGYSACGAECEFKEQNWEKGVPDA